MPRREAVVPAAIDVQQLVERIAVRQPRGAFLIGAKQILVLVEPHRHREANARRDDLARLEVGRHAQIVPCSLSSVYFALPFSSTQIAVREVLGPEAEVNRVIARIDGDAERIDLHKQFRPTGGDDHLLLGDVVLSLSRSSTILPRQATNTPRPRS